MGKYFFPPSSGDDHACLAKHEPTFYYLAVTSFLEAEKILKRCHNTTFAVWPGMSLFIHATELMMKSILVDRGQVSFNDVKNCKHDLKKLWKKIRQMREQLATAVIDEAFCTSAIEELAKIDPYGTAFRYGKDKRGNAYCKGWPETVNTDQLITNCRRLFWKLRDLHGFPDCEKCS